MMMMKMRMRMRMTSLMQHSQECFRVNRLSWCQEFNHFVLLGLIEVDWRYATVDWLKMIEDAPLSVTWNSERYSYSTLWSFRKSWAVSHRHLGGLRIFKEAVNDVRKCLKIKNVRIPCPSKWNGWWFYSHLSRLKCCGLYEDNSFVIISLV